jgi:Tetratricopeptide repeat
VNIRQLVAALDSLRGIRPWDHDSGFERRCRVDWFLARTGFVRTGMTQSIVFVAIGSAAATLGTLLIVLWAAGLWASSGKWRPALALARRWSPRDARSLGLVLVPLIAVSAVCFANAGSRETSGKTDPSTTGDWVSGVLETAPAGTRTAGNQTSGQIGGDASSARALDSLRAYADRVSDKRQVIANMSITQSTPSGQDAAGLPGVDTMIARLATRLASAPDDAEGWKMLGWSYLNTGKSQEAVKAYETALKLKPDDADIKQGLDAAKSAPADIPTADAAPSAPGSSSPGPTSEDVKSAEGLAGDQPNDMIRGMVNRLANRLETSPNDEEGWVRLMRARMVLGEKDAAKAALTKALEAFASDSSVKDRLAASARELGVDNN